MLSACWLRWSLELYWHEGIPGYCQQAGWATCPISMMERYFHMGELDLTPKARSSRAKREGTFYIRLVTSVMQG